MKKEYADPKLELINIEEKDIILDYSLEFDFDVFEDVFGGNDEA